MKNNYVLLVLRDGLLFYVDDYTVVRTEPNTRQDSADCEVMICFRNRMEREGY